MSTLEPAGSAERIAETAETLSWLTDLAETRSNGQNASYAEMADALSLARSYVVQFAAHRRWVPAIWRRSKRRHGESLVPPNTIIEGRSTELLLTALSESSRHTPCR